MSTALGQGPRDVLVVLGCTRVVPFSTYYQWTERALPLTSLPTHSIMKKTSLF